MSDFLQHECGIAMLRLDCPGEVQNTLSMDLIQEFDEVRPHGPRRPEPAS